MKIGTDFSGIGSPEMALEILGIEHEKEFACEIDKFARKSFEAVHGKPKVFYNDITTRDHSEVPKLDLYVAGFPCQAFSMAGKRQGFEDTRGTLFFNVAEFIKINQPECFILENVKGLLSHDGGRTFETIISVLSDNGGTVNQQQSIPFYDDGLGYHVFFQVLNTKNFGVPQNRERIFIVGFKNFVKFRFPVPFPLKKRLKDVLQDDPGEKYFLSETYLKGVLKHKERHEAKGTGFAVEFKDGNSIGSCLRANGALNSTDNHLKVNTDRIRRLTPLECWRLQAFPDEAFFKAEQVNSDTQLYKQAGNSISVNVMTLLIEKVMETKFFTEK